LAKASGIVGLKAIPLFEGLSDAALRRIRRLATEFAAEPGTVLIQPNQPASGLFVVEEGSVLVELRGGDRVELGPGEFFGELALLNPGKVRAARVRAKTFVRCLAISRSHFTRLLQEEPKIAIAMLRTLAARMPA
jgi:CRP-like cAMP-binding protein